MKHRWSTAAKLRRARAVLAYSLGAVGPVGESWIAMFANLIILVLFLFLVLALLRSTIKVVNEYERGVVFRLGRIQGAKGPGLFFIIPIVDQMQKVDLRVVTLDVPSQEAITRDN